MIADASAFSGDEERDEDRDAACGRVLDGGKPVLIGESEIPGNGEEDLEAVSVFRAFLKGDRARARCR